MKRIEKLLKRAAVFFAVGACVFAAAAQDLSGYDIMKRARDADTGKTGTYTATMTLVNKTGNQRVREIVYIRKITAITIKRSSFSVRRKTSPVSAI